MPYIGSSASPLPVNFAAVQAQSFDGTGSQTAFTLNRTIPGVTAIEVLVNNVQQSPYDGSYSVSGTTLTFSEAPSAGTNNVYVVYRDQSLGSLVDESAYRKAEVDSAVAAKVSKAGDTMTGALALPAGGLNVGSGQLAVDASGRVTMSSQPAFAVTNSNNTGQTGVIILDTTQVNVGGHYNTGNGRFTAPVTGSYYFIFATIVDSSGNFIVRFRKNGSNIAGVGYCSSGVNDTGVVAKVIYLSVGDYVDVETTGGDMEPQYSSFCGYLIG